MRTLRLVLVAAVLMLLGALLPAGRSTPAAQADSRHGMMGQGVGLYTDPSVANQASTFTINPGMVSCGVGTLANGSWSGPFAMLMYSLHIDRYSVIRDAGMIKATGTMRSITAMGGQTIEDATHDFVAIAKDSPASTDEFAVHFTTGFWNPNNPMCTKSDLMAGTCRFGGHLLMGDVHV